MVNSPINFIQLWSILDRSDCMLLMKYIWTNLLSSSFRPKFAFYHSKYAVLFIMIMYFICIMPLLEACYDRSWIVQLGSWIVQLMWEKWKIFELVRVEILCPIQLQHCLSLKKMTCCNETSKSLKFYLTKNNLWIYVRDIIS